MSHETRPGSRHEVEPQYGKAGYPRPYCRSFAILGLDTVGVCTGPRPSQVQRMQPVALLLREDSGRRCATGDHRATHAAPRGGVRPVKQASYPRLGVVYSGRNCALIERFCFSGGLGKYSTVSLPVSSYINMSVFFSCLEIFKLGPTTHTTCQFDISDISSSQNANCPTNKYGIYHGLQTWQIRINTARHNKTCYLRVHFSFSERRLPRRRLTGWSSGLFIASASI